MVQIIMAKKLKKKPEQLEMGGTDWEKFLKTSLGLAIHHYVEIRKRAEELTGEMELAGADVVTEMKKAGKHVLVPVVDNVMYRFEVRKASSEKLLFKRATE